MDDTICAIGTALGIGAISIIRMSGPESVKIINRIFQGSRINSKRDHTINYGQIVFNSEIIDEVLVSVMLAPKSYTREDMIEINCHGGIITTQRILQILLQSGCRLAEKGEFTKRAFLNGRLDLTQSEAVNELLKADTDKKRKLALNMLKGTLVCQIRKIRADLSYLLTNIEVGIDYPEYEDNEKITAQKIEKVITKAQTEIDKILTNTINNQIITTGLQTVLIGSPNVGKSSLLNAFLDEEKAIVTDIAGTTRDIVEGQYNLNGILINFMDTAGIRATSNLIEQIGVAKTHQVMKQADLIILVLDGTRKLNQDEQNLLQTLDSKQTIVFINKNDLKLNLKIKGVPNCIYGNTKTPGGIDSLKNKINTMFQLEKLEVDDTSLRLNLRQEKLLKEANQKLASGLKNHHYFPAEVIAIDIKAAWDLLGEITGDSYQEELIDLIFSKFCLGK